MDLGSFLFMTFATLSNTKISSSHCSINNDKRTKKNPKTIPWQWQCVIVAGKLKRTTRGKDFFKRLPSMLPPDGTAQKKTI